jgi:hypothetical protein
MGTSGYPKMSALLLAVGMIGAVQAQEVKIAADINAPEENNEPVTMTIMNSRGDVVWQRTRMHPSLNVSLPANEVYDLTFEQKGSLTKTVQVDTRSAVRPYTVKKTRKIEFDVIMEPEDMQALKYAGPVGSIDFSDRTGRMYVGYDYAMEPVRKDAERIAENQDRAVARNVN